MIFVDTGAWYARYVVDAVDHDAAVSWFSNIPDLLVTTDYVVDELLTLLKVRGYSHISYSVGGSLLSGSVCRLEYVQKADFERGWLIFSSFRDKSWSFTDCVSRAVIERLNIRTACTFDDHFRQFGTITVVP